MLQRCQVHGRLRAIAYELAAADPFPLLARVACAHGVLKTSVHSYRLTWEGALAPYVIVELFRRGIYRAWGGPTPVDAQRRHHHLRVLAENESEAVDQARHEIEGAGGDPHDADVEVVGSD